MKGKISPFVIPRLSIYYRCLLESKHLDFISSRVLSDLTGFTASQIRKDLTCFGQFGTPGKGYKIEQLKVEICKVLGIDKVWNVVLIGAGNLGQALLSYRGFSKHGFKIIMAFDTNPKKVGKKFGSLRILNGKKMGKILESGNIQLAIVAVPANEAQNVVNTLCSAGVKAILNFAPVRIQVPEDIKLINVDLSIELERLAYFLTQR